MQAHSQVASVQEEGCAALTKPCVGTDAAALACKQRAVGAGGRGAATSAPQAHQEGVAAVQRLGHWVVDNIRELERGLHEGALLKPYIHGRTSRCSMCSVFRTARLSAARGMVSQGYGERNHFDCWPGPTVKKCGKLLE